MEFVGNRKPSSLLAEMIMLSFGPTEKVPKLNSILEKNLSLCFAVPVHKMCTLLEVVLKKPVIFIIG